MDEDKKLKRQLKIQELMETDWWEMLVEYLEEQRETFKDQIVEQIDPEYNVPKYSEHDRIRKQRYFYEELKTLPEALI